VWWYVLKQLFSLIVEFFTNALKKKLLPPLVTVDAWQRLENRRPERALPMREKARSQPPLRPYTGRRSRSLLRRRDNGLPGGARNATALLGAQPPPPNGAKGRGRGRCTPWRQHARAAGRRPRFERGGGGSRDLGLGLAGSRGRAVFVRVAAARDGGDLGERARAKRREEVGGVRWGQRPLRAVTVGARLSPRCATEGRAGPRARPSPP